jgi:hypothetical protein
VADQACLQIIRLLLFFVAKKIDFRTRAGAEPVAVAPSGTLLTHDPKAPGALDQATESGCLIAFLTTGHTRIIADFDDLLYSYESSQSSRQVDKVDNRGLRRAKSQEVLFPRHYVAMEHMVYT